MHADPTQTSWEDAISKDSKPEVGKYGVMNVHRIEMEYYGAPGKFARHPDVAAMARSGDLPQTSARTYMLNTMGSQKTTHSRRYRRFKELLPTPLTHTQMGR